MKHCIECDRTLFDGSYSGSCLTKDGKNWTCSDCAKPKDWKILSSHLRGDVK